MVGVLLLAHGSRAHGAEQALESVLEGAYAALDKERICFQTAFLQFHKIDLTAGLDCLAAKGVEEILVVPFFLFEGRHYMEIQKVVDAYQKEHSSLRVRCGRTLEADPALGGMVAQRVTEMLAEQEGVF